VSIHRRNAKRDDNEQAIVDRLRQLGAQVTRLSGEGVPDLLVAWRGISRVAEVKRPKGKLTPAQVTFHAKWNGEPIPILTDADDATTWLLALMPAAQREAKNWNRTMHTLKTLEEM
jgi:hypothetical protein